jgi:acyl-CoA thioesterase
VTTTRPPPGPLAELLGVSVDSTGDGHARFSLGVRAELMNPLGVLHGGIVYTLVDYAMGAALFTRLVPGERCATLEMKINYLAPVLDGRILADAHVVGRTKRIGVLEARVHDDQDRLIALATGSFYIQGEATSGSSRGV